MLPMPDKSFNICPKCGTPKVNQTSTLILYFENKTDLDEFVAIFKEVKPNVKTYKVSYVN